MMKYFSLVLCTLFIAVSWAQTEPAEAPTAFESQNVLAYTFKIKYTAAADADGYLVLRSTSPITDEPADGQEYMKGDRIGDAKVFYSGSAAGIALGIKEVVANTTYHFAVFSYNSGAARNYLTSSKLEGTVTSADIDFGNYYNNIDFTANNVVTQLTDLINPHIAIEYGEFDENIVADFFERDTIIGGVASKYIKCQYSGEIRPYTGTFAFTSPLPGYSREHRMAFSWINFEGITRDEFEERPEGNDIHSLDLVNNDVNSTRSNYSFGVINGNPWSSSYLDFTIGTDVDGTVVNAPRPDRQGDIARALYYMMLCYNGKYGQNWGMDNLLGRADEQDLALLKQWHENDPPDAFEIARHEYVASIQNNRNPFVDFPQLVDCIDFSDITKMANCDVVIETGIFSNIVSKEIVAYPNPASGYLFFETNGMDVSDLVITDLTGRVVKKQKDNLLQGIAIHDLSNGVYLLSVEMEGQTHTTKITVKHN